MNCYPDVDDDPGAEEWLDGEKWSMSRVFQDVEKVWRFDNASMQEEYREQWGCLRRWQTAYSTADSVVLGREYNVGGGLTIGGTPPLPWAKMWEMLDSRAPRCSADVGASALAASDSALANEADDSAHVHARDLRGNARREALASSTRLSEVNILQQPGFTDADARLVQLEEEGPSYVRKNINVCSLRLHRTTQTRKFAAFILLLMHDMFCARTCL